MKTIEIPQQMLNISEDGKPIGYYPYTSYLYIFNIVCMYKAGVITKDKVRELLKSADIISLNMLDDTEDMQTIVLSFINDELK